MDESLQDGPRPVVRIGDTVHRPVQPWTPAVPTLLRHLEAVARLDTSALVRQLAVRGLEPRATWVAEGHLTELADRVEWCRAHRRLFK
ncbi:hypothetical protein OG292_23515 [Streptomyces sp. NBC_01511]|uniref:hypothetical protein n=1 Tax=unclassified Streptomyces TaxID=2593676 RepID=UPI0038651324